MTSVAAVSVARVYSPAQVAFEANTAQADEPVEVKKQEAPQMQVSFEDANLAAVAMAAAYDNRTIAEDKTPRGVEVDRIEMIEKGFEHMRKVIELMSASAAADSGVDARA